MKGCEANYKYTDEEIALFTALRAEYDAEVAPVDAVGSRRRYYYESNKVKKRKKICKK